MKQIDVKKAVTGLAAELYYVKPLKNDKKEVVPYEQIKDHKEYLLKAEKVIDMLSKLNVVLVNKSEFDKQQSCDTENRESLVNTIQIEIRNCFNTLNHPKGLKKFLNDDVISNFSIRIYNKLFL